MYRCHIAAVIITNTLGGMIVDTSHADTEIKVITNVTIYIHYSAVTYSVITSEIGNCEIVK